MKNAVRQRKTCFLVLTQARSGSYFLTSLLDSAHDITCYGEVFKHRWVELPPKMLKILGMRNDDVRIRDSMRSTFVDRLVSNTDTSIVGFKAFPAHIRKTVLKDLVEDPNWKIVFLTRNPLEVHVSSVRARRTGVYVLKGDRVPQSVLYQPVKIDLEKMLESIDRQKRNTDLWRLLADSRGAENCLFLDYTDLAQRRELDRVLNFLGSNEAAENLQSAHKKQFHGPIGSGIINFEEVSDCLIQAGHKHLLSDRSD